MAIRKSIKVNAVMNAFLTVSTILFQMVTFPYVSRTLLPTGFGKISFVTSIISYFTMFAQLGIPVYGLRACAKIRNDKEKLTKTVQELFAINIVMTAIAYIVLAIVVISIPKLREEKLLTAIISSSILLTSIGMEWLYKALEQYTYITLRSIAFKALALILTFLLVRSETDYIMFGVISIVASSASYILNFINIRKFVGLKVVGHYNFKPHLNAVLIFFAMSCATTIYTHLDTIMLGFMKTDIDVGYYNAAVKIRTVLIHLVTSIGAVLLPRSTHYIANGMMHEFYKVTKRAINFIFVIAMPMVLYFILFAKQAIYFISGNAFAGAIIPMQVIMPTLFLVGLTNIMGMQMLVPLGREKVVLYSEIIGAAVDLILNLTLIPTMASTGAAIGTLAAEMAVLIVQYIAMRQEVKDCVRSIRYFAIIIALLVGSVSSYWVIWLNQSDFTSLIVSSMLFFGSYFVVLLLFKEPMVKKIVNQIVVKIDARYR